MAKTRYLKSRFYKDGFNDATTKQSDKSLQVGMNWGKEAGMDYALGYQTANAEIVWSIYRGYDIASRVLTGPSFNRVWEVRNSQGQMIARCDSELQAQQFIDERKKVMPNHS